MPNVLTVWNMNYNYFPQVRSTIDFKFTPQGHNTLYYFLNFWLIDWGMHYSMQLDFFIGTLNRAMHENYEQIFLIFYNAVDPALRLKSNCMHALKKINLR